MYPPHNTQGTSYSDDNEFTELVTDITDRNFWTLPATVGTDHALASGGEERKAELCAQATRAAAGKQN